MGAALMAIVAEGSRGRVYLAPTREHAEAAQSNARMRRKSISRCRTIRAISGPSPMAWNFANLFTPRQLVALTTFSDLVREARERALADARVALGGSRRRRRSPLAEGGLGCAYADALATYLGLSVSKLAFAKHVGPMEAIEDQAMATFARQAIAMTWDFAEVNAFGDMAGDLMLA